MVKDRSITLTKEHILTAKEILIARQDTHLDSLAERLREKRVKNIIEPILGLFGTWYGSIWEHKSTKSLSGKRLN